MSGSATDTSRRTLLAVLAHPDDESLGVGGTLAKYVAAGVDVFLLTATRGESGLFRGYRRDDPNHPGPAALASIRETELRGAAAALGVREVTLLGYPDGRVDRTEPAEIIGRIAAAVRRIRPDVVLTFGPDGGYGHPDHIAVSQFTTAAIVAAADATFVPPGDGAALRPHAVAKLYYLAWPTSTWAKYEIAFRTMGTTVDGIERHATHWPDWAITTVLDTSEVWETVWRAVSCHQSQMAGYQRLPTLSPEQHKALWGTQTFYRVFSRVNVGRTPESDVFEGL